jgi:hypothetical protein
MLSPGTFRFQKNLAVFLHPRSTRVFQNPGHRPEIFGRDAPQFPPHTKRNPPLLTSDRASYREVEKKPSGFSNPGNREK